MKKNLLTYKNYFVPYKSVDHNCLIVNVFHAIVKGVVKDDFFVVAGQFCHSCTDRRSYNLVIILVGEVKSAIVVVVADIVVDHDHRFPGVEEAVGDDGSEGRTADDVVAIDVAAIDTVVEVVGDTVVVDRSDVVRDMHVTVVVVVVWVYIGGVGHSGTVSRAVSGTVTSGLAATGIVVAIVAGTGDRLRTGLTLFGVASLFGGAGGLCAADVSVGSRSCRGGAGGRSLARGSRGRTAYAAAACGRRCVGRGTSRSACG